MPAVFPARWTRGTILTQALQKAGNKKILGLARDRLNRLLEEIYSQWEWPFLYKEFLFAMPGGNTGGSVSFYTSFPLPNDFIKTESETTGLMVIRKDGNVKDLPIIEIDPIQFRRRAIPHDLEGDRPLIWYVDYATLFGFTWPAPTAACDMRLLYKFLPPDMDLTDPVAYDADVPLFPWGGYLAKAMELWAYQYDENTVRGRDCAAEAEAMLDTIRNIAMPRQSQEQTIPLDPQVFGPGFRDESSRYFRDWDWWGPV